MIKKMSLCCTLLTVLTLNSGAVSAEQKFAIAIHGGAGNILQKNFTAAKELAYKERLALALDRGYEILNSGGTSVAAVTAAINVMENSPLFNAGLGAVYTFDETHELDASIMDGNTKQAGAVSGVTRIKNPINLAGLVMTDSVHVMLSGAGAEKFAEQQGITLVNNNYFDTDNRYQSLIKAKRKIKALEAQSTNAKDYQANYNQLELDYKFGTVGAVAVDTHGNIAAGTSTGGMTAKRYGRIGDSPIIGAGTWADNQSCAVSATGHGEFFIRFNVAAEICAKVKYQNISLEQASREVIFGPMMKAGGTGGVIVINRDGDIALTFNTPGMYRGSRVKGSKAQVSLFK